MLDTPQNETPNNPISLKRGRKPITGNIFSGYAWYQTLFSIEKFEGGVCRLNFILARGAVCHLVAGGRKIFHWQLSLAGAGHQTGLMLDLMFSYLPVSSQEIWSVLAGTSLDRRLGEGCYSWPSYEMENSWDEKLLQC